MSLQCQMPTWGEKGEWDGQKESDGQSKSCDIFIPELQAE